MQASDPVDLFILSGTRLHPPIGFLNDEEFHWTSFSLWCSFHISTYQHLLSLKTNKKKGTNLHFRHPHLYWRIGDANHEIPISIYLFYPASFLFCWTCIQKLSLCIYLFQGLHLTNLEAGWAEVGGGLTLLRFWFIIPVHFWMALLRIIVLIVLWFCKLYRFLWLWSSAINLWLLDSIWLLSNEDEVFTTQYKLRYNYLCFNLLY